MKPINRKSKVFIIALKSNICKYLILFMISSSFCQLIIAQSLYFENGIQKIEDLSSTQIWVDSFSLFNDFSQINEQPFRKFDKFEFLDYQHAYWLYFEIENSDDIAFEYWLDVGVFDSLSLLKKRDLSSCRHRGLLIGYNEEQKWSFQSLREDKYGFKLVIPPKQREGFYLRIKNSIYFESSFSNVCIYANDAKSIKLGSQVILFILVNSAFLGVFFFLGIFSLFQYLQNRDCSYIYYSLYLGLSIIYYIWKFEKSNSFVNFIFSAFPENYYFIETPLSLLIYITYCSFVINFLKTKFELPILYKILKFGNLFFLVYLVINVLAVNIWGLSIGWSMNFLLRLILIPSGIFVIYSIFKTKHRLSYYILSGSLFMLFGGALTTIMGEIYVQHYWGVWDVPLLPIQLGMLVEVLFFSVGLGYKTKLLELERQSVEQKLLIEKKETEYQKEINTITNTFFTNITHEFRTPLTVIKGVSDELENHPQKLVQKNAILVQRNGEKLLTLVNQLLSLSKLESKKMVLHYRNDNIVNFFKYQISLINPLAEKRCISILFYCFDNNIEMDFDADKLGIVISNLLSNALKFTNINGRIIIDVSENEQKEKLKISIQDNGVGIREDELEKIFERFYQGSSSKLQGTGIGLALCKELVDLMKGNISASINSDGGLKIDVELPISQLSDSFYANNDNFVMNEGVFSKNDITLSEDVPLILLVEDDEDVLAILECTLVSKYRIIKAVNGELGINMAINHQPDLVISDIIMPQKDGYGLCQTLKNDERTDAIPIVLITAKMTQEEKNLGLNCGADAYLVKPFNRKELLIRVRNLLEIRKVLEAHFMNFTGNNHHDNNENHSQFLIDVYFSLEKNYMNDSFSGKDLCHEIGLSKSNFYRSLKKETGLSIGLFIRAFRLQKSKSLLDNQKELSIKEVAFKVGFSSPVYFSQSFKKAYQVSPKEYKEQSIKGGQS